ncbi:hypothetical protein [Clostridium saccharoperbutylacetonicum]|uniref:AtuA-related protein n=1 Tax=Clostridium saccharoperbutylacetonicum TaxID=36745 RepID=UPI0039E786E4
MKLREISHSRTGDKGNISVISVIAYDERNYEKIKAEVTVERVRKQFEKIVKGNITRYEIESLGAVNFVMENALGGGVTRSLSIDPHGKALSSLLLEIELSD